MVRENTTAKKERYVCISVDGMEIHKEYISSRDSIKDHVLDARVRIRKIQQIMPLVKWSIRIEQQWPGLGGRHFQYIDIKGKMKLKEKII